MQEKSGENWIKSGEQIHVEARRWQEIISVATSA
jgi:hypothetical protein